MHILLELTTDFNTQYWEVKGNLVTNMMDKMFFEDFEACRSQMYMLFVLIMDASGLFCFYILYPGYSPLVPLRS